MAVVYHEIYLPIDTESTFDYIVIKQGDAGTHRVRATLISNNRVYTIPTGASYFMKFRKPDNNYCLVEATVSDNTISAEVTEEMLRVSGTGLGEFMIVSGSDELKTANFHVKIVKETFTSGDVQSHSDFAPFAALLQGAGTAASNANTAAAAANAAANLAEQKAQAIPDDYSDLVADVAGKADKSTTYTKAQVDQMISDVEVETDTTLAVSGAPADAAETGRQFGLIKADLAPLTSAKSALLECLKHAKFDEDGHTYYDALEDALFPSASLESITAVYNPGQNTIYDITPLSELKRYITVTGNYEGGESKTLTAYTLSGTLVPGTNTITISAGSVTTTISVTAVRYWTYTWSYADGLPGNSGLVKETTGTVTETLESDGVRVAVENTSDKRARYYYSGLSSTQLYTEGIFELEFKVNAYGSYSVAPYGNGVRLYASLGNRNGNSVNTAQLAFNTSGVLYVKTGTINWTLLDNSAFELDTWYKVRIEQSLTKADVYVDGVFVGSILTADNKESVLRPIFTAYRGVDVTFKAFRMRVA